MRTLVSDTGQVMAVQQDDGTPGNFVVYPMLPNGQPDTTRPLWDLRGWLASLGALPAPPVEPSPELPPPPDVPPNLSPVTPEVRPIASGFLERTTSAAVRPRLTYPEIVRVLPARGAFTFPPPYNTRGIRITNVNDGAILPVGYPYWSIVNNHAGAAELFVFAGSGGGTPLFFQVDKATGVVTPIGPLVRAHRGTGECWYWSSSRPTTLYLNDGPRLHRVDVATGADEVVFDVNDHPELRECDIWQMHSSADDQVHVATVRRPRGDERAEDLGCVVFERGALAFFPKRGDYDECAIDRTGRWLVIKETLPRDGRLREDNRVIDLTAGDSRMILDEDGAAGHSDMGVETLVGENDYHALPGALCLRDLRTNRLSLQYHLTQWSIGMGHVGLCAADPSLAVVSHAHRVNAPRVNEIVLVTLDGSLEARVLAPNMTDLGPPGDADRDYNNRPKAGFDPTGEYIFFSSNAGSDRLDIFLLQR